jgi:sugar (pentulose or hexulose) kinase
MKLFIGIDLGTSGCRAIAIDEQRNIHAETAVALPAPNRSGTHVEQDPELWWTAVCDCLGQLTKIIDPQRVAAIAVDGTSATLLLTDEQGAPLGPALMYNDARAASQAEVIARIAPTNTAAQGASCALAKLMWLTEHGLPAAAAHLSHQADWIAGRLCGRFGISDYNNALKLGFDADQKVWPLWLAKELSKLDVPQNLLPKVVAPGTPIGKLENDLANRFGLSESTHIVAGTTDSTASFMATGARKVGEAVTALGSTLVVKIIAKQPIFAAEYGVYSQPLMVDGQQRWLVGGASNSGGAVLRQHFSDAQLQALTAQLKPDQPTGLNYYPLPAIGERFPINDARLEPRLEPRPTAGIDSDLLFFQGMLEGIADIEAQAYRLLSELGAPYPVSVRSTGGGAKNTAWTQIRQKRLNNEMLPADHTEAAFGTALLASTSHNTRNP